MADCFVLCEKCGTPAAAHVARDSHDPLRCERALNGFCRCDGVVCAKCCPDEECTPLQTACQVAREDVRERAEQWESAQSGPASTLRDDSVIPHPYAEFLEAMG